MRESRGEQPLPSAFSFHSAHIIHERFYCNRRYAAAKSVAARFARPAGRLALRDLNILFQVCFGLSGLRVPVSHGVLAVSSRTVINNVG